LLYVQSEVFVQINGKAHYLWRAADHAGGLLGAYIMREAEVSAAMPRMLSHVKGHHLIRLEN